MGEPRRLDLGAALGRNGKQSERLSPKRIGPAERNQQRRAARLDEAPYAHRLTQYEHHFADPVNLAAVETACHGAKVRPETVANVLRLLVSRSYRDGLVSESLEQIAAACPFVSVHAVRRSLAVLRSLGWLEVMKNAQSPGRNGGPGAPAVYRVTFLDPAWKSPRPTVEEPPPPVIRLIPAPVDNGEMSAPLGAQSFDGMSAPLDGMSAPLGAHPHGFTHGVFYKTSHTLSVEELADAQRTWCRALADAIRARHKLPAAAVSNLDAVTAGGWDRWGHLDLRTYGDRIAKALAAVATGTPYNVFTDLDAIPAGGTPAGEPF